MCVWRHFRTLKQTFTHFFHSKVDEIPGNEIFELNWGEIWMICWDWIGIVSIDFLSCLRNQTSIENTPKIESNRRDSYCSSTNLGIKRRFSEISPVTITFIFPAAWETSWSNEKTAWKKKDFIQTHNNSNKQITHN